MTGGSRSGNAEVARKTAGTGSIEEEDETGGKARDKKLAAGEA